MHYYQDYGLETRTVRFHNIFGPLGTWEGARKSPAAMCRKVACAKLTGNHEVEIWEVTANRRARSVISTIAGGHLQIDALSYREPLNLWQDRLVTINQLVDMVAHIAGSHREKACARTARCPWTQFG